MASSSHQHRVLVEVVLGSHPGPIIGVTSSSSFGGGVAVVIHLCLCIVGEWEGREKEGASLSGRE